VTQQKLAEIARKKRYLHLVEKMHRDKTLTKQEIDELAEFEAEAAGSTVVRTMNEVAKVMEVNERTVQRWKREGMPVTKDGFYDLNEIKSWQNEREGNAQRQTEGKAYWEAKIREYRAGKLKAELEKINEALLSREEVEQGRLMRIIAVKRSFLALPTRIAPTLAMKEPREIEAILYEAIGEIIDEFAGEKNFKEAQRKVRHTPDGPGSVDTARAGDVEAPGQDHGK